jgi:tRNA modification GTPase
MIENTTIAAIATAAGRGAIGIVRLSGSKALTIAEDICGKPLKPRFATVAKFRDTTNNTIDQGLALYFKAPHSFTGEDCVEFQGHGGPVILDQLLEACLQRGATLARPGQFSERAFLNDKIDLAQAEAIADLIDASSRQSAHNALQSLQGVFSQRVNTLADGILKLRLYVEAAIDFPEEEVDFLSDQHIASNLNNLFLQTQKLLSESEQGAILREGIRVVIAGKPNAGKSSLLNTLTEKNSAIVTDIAGTTRDVLKETINIDGLPLHIVDTAGLRDLSDMNDIDQVESIGIERAQQELQQADIVLWMVDSQQQQSLNLETLWPRYREQLSDLNKLIVVFNKVDLSGLNAGLLQNAPYLAVGLSLHSSRGLDTLKQQLKQKAGLKPEGGASFTARRRHLDALRRGLDFLTQAQQRLQEGAGELLAEDLRLAHQSLGEITGQVSPDELLGEIFANFCIGK